MNRLNNMWAFGHPVYHIWDDVRRQRLVREPYPTSLLSYMRGKFDRGFKLNEGETNQVVTTIFNLLNV
jgi:hypothetical protein